MRALSWPIATRDRSRHMVPFASVRAAALAVARRPGRAVMRWPPARPDAQQGARRRGGPRRWSRRSPGRAARSTRAAAASSARTVSSPASAARQAAQNRPSFRLPSGCCRDPGGEVAQVAAPGPGRLDGRVALGFEQAGDLGPVQAAGGVLVADDLVGPAADLGRRGEDVAAVGAEVQVVAGQLAAPLVAAGEVGVQPAAGGGDERGRAVDQPGALEPVERGEPVPGRAVLVDVEHVGPGVAGGDGQVARRAGGATTR